MRRGAALAAFLLLLAPTPALADDDTLPIGLDAALDTALRQNDTVLAEATDVTIAEAERQAALGADDFVIEGEVGAFTRASEAVEGPFFQDLGTDRLFASLGVWRSLSTGGRAGVVLRDDVTRTEARIAGEMPLDLEYTVYSPRAEVVLVQPLLRGRGKRAAHAGRRVAAAERDAQAAELRRAERALTRDVRRTYWELAYATREVAIRRSSLALAREQLGVTRARADVGRGSELEVLAVEQAIAAREAALVAAEQAEHERGLELRVLMAAEDGDRRRFVAADALDGAIDARAPALDDALAAAVRASPDLQVLGEHARAAAVERDAASGDLGPRLDLMLRGGPGGDSDSMGDALGQLATFDSYQGAATLTFSVPIGDRTAKARHAAARLREKRLGHAADEVRGHLTAAVRRAVDAVTLSERRIAAAAQAAELARRNVELEQARWKTGAGTNFDVLERQDQLAAAEAALARARADQRVALAELAFLTE